MYRKGSFYATHVDERTDYLLIMSPDDLMEAAGEISTEALRENNDSTLLLATALSGFAQILRDGENGADMESILNIAAECRDHMIHAIRVETFAEEQEATRRHHQPIENPQT